MGFLYHEDFNTYADGAAVSGWALAQGFAFMVRDAAIVGSTVAASLPDPATGKGFGRNNDGDNVLYTANGAMTNQAVRTDCRILANGNVSMCFGTLRSNLAGTQQYRFGLESDGASPATFRAAIVSYASGSTILGRSAYGFKPATTDIVHTEVRAVGTSIEIRLWLNSDARPSAMGVTATSIAFAVTDSTYASGYPGLKLSNPNNVWVLTDNVVITDATGGENYFDPAPSTTINCTTGNASAAGPQASIQQALLIAANVGNASAAGLQATVLNNVPGVTISCAVGNAAASGALAAVGTFVQTDVLPNNTGSVWASTAVVWTWTPSGRVGSMVGLVPVDGTGTTDASGRLAPGIALATGRLSVAVRNGSAKVDDIFEQYF